MSVAPVEVFSRTIFSLRQAFSESATFQAATGHTGDAAATLDHIWPDQIELDDYPLENGKQVEALGGDPIRPFVQITAIPGYTASIVAGGSNSIHSAGNNVLQVMLESDMPDAYSGNVLTRSEIFDAQITFLNFVGSVWKEVLVKSGTVGYPFFDNLSLIFPYSRATGNDKQKYGNFQVMVFTLDVGGRAT